MTRPTPEQLQAWEREQNREPPHWPGCEWRDKRCTCALAGEWKKWFGPRWEYLGERSGRTGPDAVDAKQRCGCSQCNQNATGDRNAL